MNLSMAPCDIGVVSQEYYPIGNDFPLGVCPLLVAPPGVVLVAAISLSALKTRLVDVVPLLLVVVAICPPMSRYSHMTSHWPVEFAKLRSPRLSEIFALDRNAHVILTLTSPQ